MIRIGALTRNPALRWGFLAAIVAATAWFGFDPKGYRFSNELRRVDGGAGVEFGSYGIAHTEAFSGPEEAEGLNATGFALDFGAAIGGGEDGRFQILLSFHAGDSQSQFILGQWRHYLIVMNGDDYDHERRLPRLTVDLRPYVDERHRYCLSTGPDGTRLTVDGERVAEKKGLHLLLPAVAAPAVMTLGNSAYLSHPWSGVLYEVAVRASRPGEPPCPGPADGATSPMHSAKGASAPWLLSYSMGQLRGDRIPDRSGSAMDLVVPRRPVALANHGVLQPLADLEADDSFIRDAVINVFGFMPLGLALALALQGWPWKRRSIFPVAVSLAALLSGTIEIGQLWLPSRDTSILDFGFNVFGAAVGAAGLLLTGLRPGTAPE